jgi:hypothetical protein
MYNPILPSLKEREMQEESFPFRLDQRTHRTVSGLVALMVREKFNFQATVGRTQMLFLDKEEGIPIDAPVSFSSEGITLSYPLNAIAKYDLQSKTWLRQFHQYLVSKRGNLVPVSERCGVAVEARYDGQIKYHLTYMTAHDDGSLAQDMPQGKLYAVEPLFLHAEPAEPAPASEPAPAKEPASWLGEED